MKKILLSLSVIAFVGVAAVGATGAFFSDTETSTGNTFTAGAIDLKVDSTSHFNDMICQDTDNDGRGDEWHADPNGQFNGDDNGVPSSHYPQPGDACDGTWAETDLDDGVYKFFNFTDLKPGDEGEDTISLHVYDNDAWGSFKIETLIDEDNGCTEPEVSPDSDCSDTGDTGADGELDDALVFTGWLDQGMTAGFQNIDENGNPISPSDSNYDKKEGDNIYNDIGDPFWPGVHVGDLGPFAISDVLAAAYSLSCVSVGNVDGHNDYLECQGLAEDGRMVGSTTYYFGLAWKFDENAGNDTQTDKLGGNMVFEVTQHRNQDDPYDI